MELINNTTKTLKDDLSVEIKQGSKLSIAAACFSIYAFQELKEQLSQIEELRFIFTSPTFVTEKAKKERREFYIPRLTRERNLYGTEFEIKLRNELTQKAIPLRENTTALSLRQKRLPKALIRRFLPRRQFKTMCLLMARPKKVLSVSLPKIWMLRRKFVSTLSCPEPSRFPRR